MLNQTVAQNQQKLNRGKAALAYAERFSWAVVPLHSIRNGFCTCGREDCTSPGKHPLTRNGVKDASKDPAVIAGWWKRWPWANVAIAAGQASDFFAVDIDGETGEESLRELEDKHGKLPSTVEQITGSGGRHILFRCPDFTVANKVRLAPGIDVKGCGGYVVAPPSLHVSGKRYEWELSSRPGEVEIAAAPAWLVAMLRPPETAGQAKTASEWQKLATTPAPEGERNDRVAKIAGHLLRRYVDPYLASELVQTWNQAHCRPPLPADEVERVLESLADKELRRRKAVSQ